MLCTGTIVTVLTVIVAGLANFDASLLTFPGRVSARSAIRRGLGAAMLIAIYDYLGYYNVCHLGDEVRDPAKTIPRAVIDFDRDRRGDLFDDEHRHHRRRSPGNRRCSPKNIAADFMEQLYGRPVAVAFTWLILWTCLAGMFAHDARLLANPLCGGAQRRFFRAFASCIQRKRYPAASLVALGGLTALLFLCTRNGDRSHGDGPHPRPIHRSNRGPAPLADVLRPDVPLPFRMWLYPIPSLVANVGWIFVLFPSDTQILQAALAVLLSGLALFTTIHCGTKRGEDNSGVRYGMGAPNELVQERVLSIVDVVATVDLPMPATGPSINSTADILGIRAEHNIKSLLGLVAAAPLSDAIFTAPAVVDGRSLRRRWFGRRLVLRRQNRSSQSGARRPTAARRTSITSPRPPWSTAYVHFGTTAGDYYVLRADTGDVVAKIAAAEPIFSCPVIADDQTSVYFVTLGSRVHAVTPEGRVRWTWDYVREVLKFTGDRWSGAEWAAHKKGRVSWQDQFLCSRDMAAHGKTLVVPTGGTIVWLDDAGDRPVLRAGYTPKESPAHLRPEHRRGRRGLSPVVSP